MKKIRLISLILSLSLLGITLISCGKEAQTEETTNSEEQSSAVDTTTAEEKKTPEQALSILNRKGIIDQDGKVVSDIVSRIAFAKDLSYISGFLLNSGSFICENKYSDLAKYSEEMKYAEICSNQGFLPCTDDEYKPDAPITYAEAVKGILYAIGYREYTEKIGVMELGKNTGLCTDVDAAIQADSELTYGTFAQLLTNALSMKLVQCVERDGDYTVVERVGSINLFDTYVNERGDKSKTLFKIANEGWDAYEGGGYRYGPSMIINDDKTIDMWTASNADADGEVDWGKYRKSYDNGFSWTVDTGAVRPAAASEVWNWSCDPGVFKLNDYYYSSATSILWHDGLDNNAFICRSKTPNGCFNEYWDGTGWGGDPKAVVAYDGKIEAWGAGEGSFVVVDDTIYCYFTFNDNTTETTRCYTAPANDPNWPGKLEYQGVCFEHFPSEDSCDVKYIDAYNCFVAVATADRFTENCYIHIWVSYDGIYFRHEGGIYAQAKGSNFLTCAHNMGISSNGEGHIDIFNQQYVAYAHQPEGYAWANWPTRMAPVVWVGTEQYETPETVIKNKAIKSTKDTKNTPATLQLRMASNKTRTVDADKLNEPVRFLLKIVNKNGREAYLSMGKYTDVEYIYDKTKATVDVENHTVTLLAAEVVRIQAFYDGAGCEFAVIPSFLPEDKPAALYPEVETVYFIKRTEVKQPAFIAKSSHNNYLMLWGDKSSFTHPNNKDTAIPLRKWEQKITLSGWDESIITVDQKTGIITPKAVGETTVIGTYMGMTASIKVVVADLG